MFFSVPTYLRPRVAGLVQGLRVIGAATNEKVFSLCRWLAEPTTADGIVRLADKYPLGKVYT